MSAPVDRRPRGRGPLVSRLVGLSCLASAVLSATVGFAAPPASAAPAAAPNAAPATAPATAPAAAPPQPATPATITPSESATSPLSVQITGTTVSGATRDATVMVTGTVRNTTAAPVYDVRARIWRSTTPLRSPAAVADALAADEAPHGASLTARAGQTFAVTQPTAALAPGASATFVVNATVADLGFAADTSYWIGADLTGAPAAGGAWSIRGSGRLLTSVPGDSATRIISVVDLSSRPRRLRPNLFADDTLGADLAATGRLGRLLDAADTPGYSWIVDPSLVEEVIDMADGYRVVDGSASVPGTAAEQAAAWLAAFRALPAGTGLQSLYARPDLVGGLASGGSSVLDRAIAATDAAGLGLPVIAVAERVDAASLSALGARSIPVLHATVEPAEPWAAVGSAHLAEATTLLDAVTSPALGDSPTSRAAAAVAYARASGQQVRLIRTPDVLTLDAAATPSWAVRGELADLLSATPEASDGVPKAPEASGALSATLVRGLERTQAALATYGSAAPATGLRQAASALVANAASEAWLTDPQGRTGYLRLVEQRSHLAALPGGVSLSVTPTVTLSAETGQFPATITNGLSDSIVVRVAATSDNSARLKVEPSEWVTIRPGDRFSALMAASPAASGVVGVELYIETRDGVRLGPASRVTVEATNLGVVGWIIVGVSGTVLFVTTALRIRQMRRKEHR